MKPNAHIIIGLFFLFCSNLIYAKTIKLHVPILDEIPTQHIYFHELLEKSIRLIGHEPVLITKQYPQLRIKHYLKYGRISVYWMIESKERNQNFLPIQEGITDGLIGKRILLIRKGDQHLFNTVQTLEDFRQLKLVAGLGKKWFDGRVWNANDLIYLESSGNWKRIFKLIPKGRPYHYFPRGMNEVITDANRYPDLAIEKRLVLIYDRDFRFYLSKEGRNAVPGFHSDLDEALKKAKQTGLISRLIQKHWKEDFTKLNYKNRIKLYLKTPN